MKKQNKEITLKDIFDIFIPKLWMIIVLAVVCATALSVFSAVKKPTYTSSSMIYVQSQSNDNITTGDITLAEDMVEVYKVMLYESDIILGRVVNALKNEYIITADHIRGMLSIQQLNETPVLRINVTASDKYLAFRVSEEIYKYSQELPSALGGENKTSNLTVAPVGDPVEGAVVENSKNVVRNAIIGFLAGALVAMIFIWIYSMLDVVIRNSKKIEDALDVPVLAVIPRHDIAMNEEGAK